jgi:SAM-dependent methyltransferase
MVGTYDLTGLDHAFLRYIGVNPTDQRQNQRLYLPFFKDCERVADLGCGDGDFVQLLLEQGIQAVGVDSDPVAIEHLRQRSIPVVSADAVSFLKSAETDSLDGLFAAHLVEHMPYEAVYELIFHAYRVLRPGGRIVLVTPNARGLISHLEMYWLHFGHVSFYHPRLLCFFLQHAGFGAETWGENPAPAYPIFGDIALHRAQADAITNAATQIRPCPQGLDPDRTHPSAASVPFVQWSASVPRSLLARGRNFLRFHLARLLGLDDAIRQVNVELSRLSAAMAGDRSCVSEGFATVSNGLNAEAEQRAQLSADVAAMIERVDRPFECYATAIKPAPEEWPDRSSI